MAEKADNQTLFKCPVCHMPLMVDTDIDAIICNECSSVMKVTNQIPLLVRDSASVERMIGEAKKAGRENWYEESQFIQWQGPYRHHLKKRQKYVESVLNSYPNQLHRPLIGLDLGCGDGGNIKWLSKYVSTLYACDYNLVRLIRASSVPGTKKVFMAEATDFPAIDNSFDVVFFNHVLEHIRMDEKALSEVYRILKPGGMLVLGVPNEGAFFWRLAYKLQPSILASTDHIHFYTARSISEKCLRAGFTIQFVEHIGWGVPHWQLDSILRKNKWVDDLLEKAGRTFFQSQATSLYLVMYK